MKRKKIIKKIINLPVEFYSSENEKSIYDLLQNTEYFEKYDRIKENRISKALNDYPEYIDNWLDWSANKRTTSGWYFIKENEQYEVGYFDTEKEEANEKTKYSDIKEACSVFIKREIESIRKS